MDTMNITKKHVSIMRCSQQTTKVGQSVQQRLVLFAMANVSVSRHVITNQQTMTTANHFTLSAICIASFKPGSTTRVDGPS